MTARRKATHATVSIVVNAHLEVNAAGEVVSCRVTPYVHTPLLSSGPGRRPAGSDDAILSPDHAGNGRQLVQQALAKATAWVDSLPREMP